MEMVKKRGWSKWGGGRINLIKEHTDIWYCQACGEEQTIDCPAFMFPFGENWLRICSDCESKVVHVKIIHFEDLKESRGHWIDRQAFVTLSRLIIDNVNI